MKNEEKDERNLYIILALAFILILIVVMIRSFRIGGANKQVAVGGVFIGECTDKGWNESHGRGLETACEKMNCSFFKRENVPEEEAALSEAVDALINEGCTVIFLTSQGYGVFADPIAKSHSDTAFFCLDSTGEAKNRISYFARLYQVRYLSGIIAGKASNTGVLGYVAADKNPQTNRGINAYALGMRYANPDARLLVYFTGSYENEAEEKKAVRLLASEGADVITYHEDKPFAIEAAEELGLFSTGYDAVYTDYSERFLAAALYDWEVIYERAIGDYLSGRANFSDGYWLDLSDGAVKLAIYSPRVSEETRQDVEQETSRIQTNRDVFSGVIYDSNGMLRCGENERISDEELYTGMKWFVEGVEIYEE